MAVSILDVQRVDGRAKKVSALVGDIEVAFIWPEGEERPKEVSRLRHGVTSLSRDSLWIPPGDYRDLCRTVYKIFGEVRRPLKMARS